MFPSSHIGCTSCPKAPPSGDWPSQIKPICAWRSFDWKCSRAHTFHSHKTLGKRRWLVAMGRSCNSSNCLERNQLWAWRFRWKEHTNLLWSWVAESLWWRCEQRRKQRLVQVAGIPVSKMGVSLETNNNISLARFLLHFRFSGWTNQKTSLDHHYTK